MKIYFSVSLYLSIKKVLFHTTKKKTLGAVRRNIISNIFILESDKRMYQARLLFLD